MIDIAISNCYLGGRILNINTFYDNLLQRPILHDIVKEFLGTIHGIE